MRRHKNEGNERRSGKKKYIHLYYKFIVERNVNKTRTRHLPDNQASKCPNVLNRPTFFIDDFTDTYLIHFLMNFYNNTCPLPEKSGSFFTRTPTV